MFRQGDVAIFPYELARQLFPFIDEKATVGPDAMLPKPAPTDKDGNVILAYGETSGHMHAVMEAEPGTITKAINWGQILEFEVSQETTIEHIGYKGPRDHNPISLPPGRWVSVGQREYSPVTVTRPVFD